MLIQIPFLTTPNARCRSERALHPPGQWEHGGNAFPLGYHSVPLSQNLHCKPFQQAISDGQSMYLPDSPAEAWAPACVPCLGICRGTARFKAPAKVLQETSHGSSSAGAAGPPTSWQSCPSLLCLGSQLARSALPPWQSCKLQHGGCKSPGRAPGESGCLSESPRTAHRIKNQGCGWEAGSPQPAPWQSRRRGR